MSPITTLPDKATQHIRVHGGPCDGQLVHWPYGFRLRINDLPGHYNAQLIAVRDTYTFEGYWVDAEPIMPYTQIPRGPGA